MSGFDKRNASPNHILVECILLADEINRNLRACVGDGKTDAHAAIKTLVKTAEKCEALKRKCYKTQYLIRKAVK